MSGREQSGRVETLAGVRIHASAWVDAPAQIGAGTAVWHFCHVEAGAQIGRDCVLGQNVYVAAGAEVGDRVRVQNNVSVYRGSVIEDDVFLGPSCVLTNVVNPRAEINRQSAVQTTRLRRGATVGAGATVVCGVTLGRYCFVGAGAVVTRDVADYALVVGTPARAVGWMSRHGHRLAVAADGTAVCPESGLRYQLTDGQMRCLDLDEDQPLGERPVGVRPYRARRHDL